MNSNTDTARRNSFPFGEQIQEPNIYHGARIVGDYRYSLYRMWDFKKPKATWIMLNPSTADADKDDPTIKRCIWFSKKFGCGGMTVVNLFPFRATSPKALTSAHNPLGMHNKNTINTYCHPGRLVICAWGNHGDYMNQAMWTIDDIQKAHGVDTKLWRLGPPTKSGQPRHPLYLSKDTELELHRLWTL